jgi:hypothetical protein
MSMFPIIDDIIYLKFAPHAHEINAGVEVIIFLASSSFATTFTQKNTSQSSTAKVRAFSQLLHCIYHTTSSDTYCTVHTSTSCTLFKILILKLKQLKLTLAAFGSCLPSNLVTDILQSTPRNCTVKSTEKIFVFYPRRYYHGVL